MLVRDGQAKLDFARHDVGGSSHNQNSLSHSLSLSGLVTFDLLTLKVVCESL